MLDGLIVNVLFGGVHMRRIDEHDTNILLFVSHHGGSLVDLPFDFCWQWPPLNIIFMYVVCFKSPWAREHNSTSTSIRINRECLYSPKLFALIRTHGVGGFWSDMDRICSWDRQPVHAFHLRCAGLLSKTWSSLILCVSLSIWQNFIVILHSLAQCHKISATLQMRPKALCAMLL